MTENKTSLAVQKMIRSEGRRMLVAEEKEMFAIAQKFRVKIEMLDETYTDHWEGEWVIMAEHELARPDGLEALRHIESLAELTTLRNQRP
jgi:hypothetical protein